MKILALALLAVAAYNAEESIRGRRLTWSVAVYWTLVAGYWLLRFMEKGG